MSIRSENSTRPSSGYSLASLYQRDKNSGDLGISNNNSSGHSLASLYLQDKSRGDLGNSNNSTSDHSLASLYPLDKSSEDLRNSNISKMNDNNRLDMNNNLFSCRLASLM
jgi:hypothetical protein